MADGASCASTIDLDAFEACLAPLLLRSAGLVVAVSGGPDSICLMHLVAQLAARGGLPPCVVASVDHGLRPGSRREAEGVLAQAAGAGLPARLLTWSGPKPERALQEKARAARYALLVGLCRELGADVLLTAHTADDQAETMLFRMARGSGPAGLAGMRPVAPLPHGVRHIRPLLAFAKARLVATCAARGWRTLHDPSNDDPRFARTRLRRVLPALAAEGLDADAFARLSHRLARAEAALDHATELIGRDALRPTSHGWEIDLQRLAALPAEFTTRLIGRALRARRPASPLRLDRLEAASEACLDAVRTRATLTRTLHGCLLQVSAGGCLSICPEGRRRRGAGLVDAAAAASGRVEGVQGPSLGKGDGDPYIAG